MKYVSVSVLGKTEVDSGKLHRTHWGISERPWERESRTVKFFSNPTLFSIISWSFQTFRCFSQSVRISKQTLLMNFSWKSDLKKHSELTIFKTKENHRFLKSASFSGKTLFFLGLKYSWCYT